MHLTQNLELFPDYRVTQMLFKEVKNAAELRQSAVEGKINAALIKPTMLVNPFQVLVAANKAVHLQKVGKMKTRSLYSEIIFNLSPTNNISEAFKRFGISDGDDSVLVVVVHDKKESQFQSDIASRVDGLQVPVEDVSSLSDHAKIKKLYKVTPQEEKCGSLLDAIVCRMATKDVIFPTDFNHQLPCLTESTLDSRIITSHKSCFSSYNPPTKQQLIVEEKENRKATFQNYEYITEFERLKRSPIHDSIYAYMLSVQTMAV